MFREGKGREGEGEGGKGREWKRREERFYAVFTYLVVGFCGGCY